MAGNTPFPLSWGQGGLFPCGGWGSAPRAFGEFKRRGIDPVLTTIARGWRAPENVGTALFPDVSVPAMGGKIISFGDEAWRDFDTARAPGARAAELQIGYEGEDFALQIHSMDAKVPREWMQDARQVVGIDLSMRALDVVMGVMVLEKEREHAKLATTVANYATGNTKALSGTDQWSHAESNPSQAVADAMEVVRAATGFTPNVGVIGAEVYSKLRFHKQLLENVKYTSKDSVSVEQLRSLWNLDALHIGQAISRSGTGTNTDIWGKNAILAYVPQAGGARMEKLSYGYTYVLQGYPMVEMPRWDASTRSHLYGMDCHYKAVIAGKTSAYLLTNVVAEERMMSEKQTYEVIYTVEHNGALYKKGTEISLSEEDAAGLLACDAICEYPKPAAKPMPEQGAASAQPAEQAAKPKKSNKQWGNIWPTKQEAEPAAKPTPEQEVAPADQEAHGQPSQRLSKR